MCLRWAVPAAVLFAAGPASAAEKRYGLTNFEAIEVNADIVVEVTTRAPVSAVATGPQDALDRLVVEARNGRLIVSERKFAGDEKRRAPHGAVTLRVNAAGLRSAMLGGAGALQIDRMKGAHVTIGLRGPGSLTVGAVSADRMSVSMIGNGAMTLAGSAKLGELKLSGAGMLDAGRLTIDALASDSEGAGDHILNATKTAAITSRGIGKTVVLGRPVCTVRNIGSGTVTCGSAR